LCGYSRLTIPNDSSYLDITTQYVGGIAAKFGFDHSDTRDIERAVSEAVSNVIEHAFEPSEHATIEISCERVPLGIKITVHDKGLPFDPDQAPECPLPEEALTSAVPGCGLFVMKEVMDEVHFHNLGMEGKALVLVKHLKDSEITDYYEACDLGPYAVPEGDEPRSQAATEIEVRPMNPSEAVEVSRCVYKAYGYSYANDLAYYPERLVQLNRSGVLSSAVAVTSDGQIAGHCALIRWNGKSAIVEIGMAAVKPEFRSQGIFKRISRYLMQRAESEGLTGIYGQAVTNHTYSQQVGHRLGMKDCALLVGFVPQTASFKGITDRLVQRETLVTHFMYLQAPASAVLYPPAAHAEMVRRIYARLGVSHEIGTSTKPLDDGLPSQSNVRTRTFKSLSTARIDVEAYGQDIVIQVRERLKDLCFKRLDVIYLYLDLRDARTAVYAMEFEKLGFFFSGILPGALPGDALILQYLNNVPIDYDRLKLEGELGRELLAYVKHLDPHN